MISKRDNWVLLFYNRVLNMLSLKYETMGYLHKESQFIEEHQFEEPYRKPTLFQHCNQREYDYLQVLC